MKIASAKILLASHCKHLLFDHMPHDINAHTFSKFISNNDVPLIIDCWASWCGPCRMFAPIFAQAADELEPYFRLVKLDTEANPTLFNQLTIRSIPTLIAFKNSQIIRCPLTTTIYPVDQTNR